MVASGIEWLNELEQESQQLKRMFTELRIKHEELNYTVLNLVLSCEGAFDRPCEECGGNKVLRYIDWDSPQTHSVRQVKKMLEDIWESRALDAAERRAGC